jgi:hypothetical protein
MTTNAPHSTAVHRVYRDDVARVFDRMQTQYGQSFDFPVGVCRDENDDYAWRWYSHIDYDGIGAMVDLARNEDFDLPQPQLKIRREEDATFFDYLRPFLRRSYLRAAPRSPWDRPQADPSVSTGLRVPQHVISLSEVESRKVNEVARSLEVTVSSILLWSLSEAVRGHAVEPKDRQHWTVPVNMRGGVGVPADAANPLSFIRVTVRPTDSVQVIHARLYDLLDTGMHWVMMRWTRFFANRSRMKFPPVRSTGCFSNVGAHRMPFHRAVFCAPVGPTEPIAAGVLTCNERMSIAFSVHHSMNPSRQAIDAVAERWRAAMLSGERP